MSRAHILARCLAIGMIAAAALTPAQLRGAETTGSMDSCYFCEPFIECPSDDWIKGYRYALGCPTDYPGCSGGSTPSCPNGLMIGCN